MRKLIPVLSICLQLLLTKQGAAQDCLDVPKLLEGKWKLDSVIGLGFSGWGISSFKEQSQFPNYDNEVKGIEFSKNIFRKFTIKNNGDTLYSDSSLYFLKKQSEDEGEPNILKFVHPISLDTGKEEFYLNVKNENLIGVSYSQDDSLNMLRSYLQYIHEYSKLYPDTMLEKKHFSGTWYMNRPFCDLAIEDTLILDRNKTVDKLRHQDFPCILGDSFIDYQIPAIKFDGLEYTFDISYVGFTYDRSFWETQDDSAKNEPKRIYDESKTYFGFTCVHSGPQDYYLNSISKFIIIYVSSTKKTKFQYFVLEEKILLVRIQ